MGNTQKSRAAAEAALDAYTRALDGKPLTEYDEPQTALQDLLTDLMHLADHGPLGDDDGLDFDAALARAYVHHSAETGAGDDIAQDDRRTRDDRNLGDALYEIRKVLPGAVAVNFQASDQGCYGFVLASIETESGEKVDPDVALPGDVLDKIADLLCDLDWDGVVGESPQGHARWVLADTKGE